MTALFRLAQLSFGFPGHPVLEGVEFELYPGERIGLDGLTGRRSEAPL